MWYGNAIESKQDITYLCITLDQSLLGDNIANKTVSKCSNKVKFLHRNARNFDKKVISIILTTPVHHGILDFQKKKSKSRLQVSQDKVIRFMLNLLGHVYNIFHSNAPVYMKNNFHISNSRTRNSVYYFNITRVGSFSKDSFYYTGAKLWNDIPPSVHSSQTRHAFKNSIKNIIFLKF